MRAAPNAPTACPCGSQVLLEDCCGRFHRAWVDQRWADMAPDGLLLMRSRYTAYVLDLTDYLLSTWHLDHRPVSLSVNEPGLQWLGLEIRAHRKIDPTREEVEFVARSKLGGRAHRLHERSRFVLEGGRWYYLDGINP